MSLNFFAINIENKLVDRCLDCKHICENLFIRAHPIVSKAWFNYHNVADENQHQMQNAKMHNVSPKLLLIVRRLN